MKLSPLEENGLRCLLQIARRQPSGSITITELSKIEGLSIHNVAKLMRILRKKGFIESVRGQLGGYKLSRPAQNIVVSEVLSVLGGKLYHAGFCNHYAGNNHSCLDSNACSVRSLWSSLQDVIDGVLRNVTIADLLAGNISYTSQEVRTISDDTGLSKENMKTKQIRQYA